MCIATAKSMTIALKALRALNAEGIEARVVNLDTSMTEKGCAYGVSFDCRDGYRAEKTLKRKNINYSEIIGG